MTLIENIDTIEAQDRSVTATVCEQAQLFGATPERDEFDSREVWDADDATDAVSEAFRILAEGVAPDGFQIADERESLLWGFVNMLDAQTRRLDRAADKLMPDLRDLQKAQDGTEIKSLELEMTTHRAQCLTDRRDAFETLRDTAADAYRNATGSVWRPRRGSHVSETGRLTSAGHRRPRLPAREEGPQDHGASAAGNPRRHRRRQGTSPTRARSSACSTGPAPSMATWCWSMAGGPRRREDRGKLGRAQRRPPGRLQAGLGPSRTRRPRSAATTSCCNLLPKGVIAFPRFGHHREPSSTRRARSASRSAASDRSASTGRVVIPASGRRRGPFRFPTDGVAAAPSSSRASRRLAIADGRCDRRDDHHGNRHDRHPRQGASHRCPRRRRPCRSSARSPADALARARCRDRRAPPPAERPALPPVLVTALAPRPPSTFARHPRPLRGVPRQPPLKRRGGSPSAGFPGDDFPNIDAADFAVPTARGGFGFTPPRIVDAGVPWGSMPCPCGAFRCQRGPCGCWSERVSRATRGSSPPWPRMAPRAPPAQLVRNSSGFRIVFGEFRVKLARVAYEFRP